MKRILLITLLAIGCVSYVEAADIVETETVAKLNDNEASIAIVPEAKEQATAMAMTSDQSTDEFRPVVEPNFEISVSPRQHHIVSWFNFVSIDITPVKKLKIGVSYINFLGLRNQDGAKSYLTSNGIGGSVSYKVYQPAQQPHRGIDVTLRYGHSIGNGDLKYGLYDFGVVVFEKLGVGFRFVDSRTSGIRNTNSIYFSWSIL